MKTSHEIALDFSEKFQNNYPQKPLFQMMEDLKIEIDRHGKVEYNNGIDNCINKIKNAVEPSQSGMILLLGQLKKK